MSIYKSHIANYLGGISTIPTSSRNPNEVTDAENCLFSDARGAYKRPGTKRIVSNLDQWGIDLAESMIEVFPVGEDVLQCVVVQDGKAHVFWVNVDESEIKEFVDHYTEILNAGEYERAKAQAVLDSGTATPQEETDARIKLNGANEKIQIATSKLNHKGFYHGKEDILEDPQNPELKLDSPVISTTKEPEGYLKVEEDKTPEETFRVTKNQSRLFILNRDKEVGLRGDTFPGNDEFRHHYLIYFVALTSGQDVSVTFNWKSNSGAVTQKLDLGQIGIETAGEKLKEVWDGLTETPEGFEIKAKGQVVSIRILDTATISDLSFEFSNIAHVELSENEEIRSVPSFRALPPTAPNHMVVQVSGSAVTKLDDVWVRFEKTEEE